ncbi:hypothetical protein M9H77_33707 [Catharanthus roseus]|uniref:Uncharacterized protein n=1 Tax=Catharanthus roseus TaxID=4058 RepID=A0ACB9ZNB8_CATRO|nr:hypothetical protein M9H77_33707 [Catharanthus roseus]
MEYKHFSHNHGLIFHQMPQLLEEIQYCSGCSSPISSHSSVFVCWQCNFFLHDQCYRATRSLKHPSHPLHPLTLVPYPTYPSNSFYCNSCYQIGTGFSYCCSECDFDLHIHCAHQTLSHFLPNYESIHHPVLNPVIRIQEVHAPTPNFESIQAAPIQNYESIHHGSPTPVQVQEIHVPTTTEPTHIVLLSDRFKKKEIKHFSHPHPLHLQEIKDNSTTTPAKTCSGCEDDLSGEIYTCTKSKYCNFNLHKSCFDLPREIRHKSHLEHNLILHAKSTGKYTNGEFACNACLKMGSAFVYNCSTCDFDLHIECASLPDSIKRPDHKHPLMLFYSSPDLENETKENEVIFVCDVCGNEVDNKAWTYYCHECEFGTHLECVGFEVLAQANEKSEEELIRETQMKLAVLQLLLNGGVDGAAAAAARGGGGGLTKEIKLLSASKK